MRVLSNKTIIKTSKFRFINKIPNCSLKDDDSDTNSEGSEHELYDSDNDEWETASEVEDNEGIIEELIIGSPPAPEVSDDPGSPTVENVDIEALNNANNLAAQLPAQESSKGNE